MRYTIQEGDTLAGIAARFHTSIGAVGGANDTVMGLLAAGAEIAIAGRAWSLAEGGTLASTAAQAGVCVGELSASIAYETVLQIGIVIEVLPGEPTANAAALVVSTNAGDSESAVLHPGQSCAFPAQDGVQQVVILVNLSQDSGASYVIASAEFSQQGRIPPVGAAAIPPRVYHSTGLVINVTSPKDPADIQVTVQSI